MIIIHDDHFYIMLHSFFSSALASVTTIILTNLYILKKNNLHFLISFLFMEFASESIEMQKFESLPSNYLKQVLLFMNVNNSASVTANDHKSMDLSYINPNITCITNPNKKKGEE